MCGVIWLLGHNGALTDMPVQHLQVVNPVPRLMMYLFDQLQVVRLCQKSFNIDVMRPAGRGND